MEKIILNIVDDGDNILSKNLYFSELAGLYCMWKQSKADILGLCH